MTRILLTGKNGQLGFELQRSLAPLGKVTAVEASNCDLSDASSLQRLVTETKPEVIINTAAYTAVDRAESQPDLAHAVNAKAPGVLGEAARAINAWVVHYSTDYVFDGDKDGRYHEDDTPNPLNVYGKSKRDGELALQQSGARYFVLRTSWVVGAHGDNFAKTTLRLAAERDGLKVVSDQVGAPTTAARLADVTAHLLRQWQILRRQQLEDSNFPWGLYHVSAAGETSWYDYARFVVETARAAGAKLRMRPEDIRPIKSADYPLPARRPANSRLDSTRFCRTFELKLPDWRLGVAHVLQQLLDQIPPD